MVLLREVSSRFLVVRISSPPKARNMGPDAPSPGEIASRGLFRNLSFLDRFDGGRLIEIYLTIAVEMIEQRIRQAALPRW